MAEESTSVVPYREEERLSVFDPRWMAAAGQLTDRLAKSSLVRADLRGKPADIFLILMKGYELNLQPTQALTELYVINGKVGMSASLIVGLCVSHPRVCEYFTLVESSERVATYITSRKGSPKAVQMSFTIEEAARAGLVQGANWNKYRSAMLRARAATALARVVYPDLVSGLYSREELQDGVVDTSLEAASPQAAESHRASLASAPAAVATVGNGSVLPREQAEPEPDQPPLLDGPPLDFPAAEEVVEAPPLSVSPPPPGGRFDQVAFMRRAEAAKDYREKLKLTKELYAALHRKELTELEAAALRRKVQEKRA